MNRLVLYIVLLLGLASCAMQKKVVSQDVQAESRISRQDSIALSATIDQIVKQALTDNLISLTHQDIRVDRTSYSAPDSSGKQYIITEEVITIETMAEENRVITAEYNYNYTEQVDSVATSASIEDLEMEAMTDIQTGLPLWQKILMLLGAAVLLSLAIRILFRLI